eukprot:1158421-Pelagomonas_calceolata.AAC.8
MKKWLDQMSRRDTAVLRRALKASCPWTSAALASFLRLVKCKAGQRAPLSSWGDNGALCRACARLSCAVRKHHSVACASDALQILQHTCSHLKLVLHQVTYTYFTYLPAFAVPNADGLALDPESASVNSLIRPVNTRDMKTCAAPGHT